VPIGESVTEVIGFKTFEAILEDIDASSINIVLNNIHPLKTKFDDIYKAIATMEHTRLLNTIVRNRQLYKDTMKDGKSVFSLKSLRRKYLEAKSEIEALRDELI
jgi:chromosome partitioning protein